MKTSERLPKETQERLKDLRGVQRAYVHYGTGDYAGVITEIVCKLCGVVLQGLAPDARVPIRHSRIEGTDVVRRDIVYTLRPTPHYAEVTVEVDEPDGSLSLHTTPLCRRCAASVADEQAVDLFLADVEQWAIDDDLAGKGKEERREFYQAQARRQPRRVLREGR